MREGSGGDCRPAPPAVTGVSTVMRSLPHLGQRILKTGIAVFLCLVIYHILGYRGDTMPTEAAITAIICLQPYIRDTRQYAINRLAGSLIGAVWGLIFILILMGVARLGVPTYVLYAVMGVGIVLALYTTVALKLPDASSLAGIVFICVVVAFPDIERPLYKALLQMADVFIGTLVAIGVNIVHLPRRRRENLVIFLRTSDLVPGSDEETGVGRINPAVLFQLNRLYEDGAKICLMSEHAPAYLALQLSASQLNASKMEQPVIVMDGAAVFDLRESCYRAVTAIRPADADWLRQRLGAKPYFVYTIHRKRTCCIYHQGEMTELEQRVYQRMQKTPYREYLQGENYAGSETVYFKLIGTDEEIRDLQARLELPASLRAVIRKQNGMEGVSALYIYAADATMVQAERLLTGEGEETEDIIGNCRNDRDALRLMSKVRNCYEPVTLPWQKRRA